MHLYIQSFKIIIYGDIKIRPKINHQISPLYSDKQNNNIYTTDLFLDYYIKNTFRIGVEGYSE